MRRLCTSTAFTPESMVPRSAEACLPQHAILGPPLASQTDNMKPLLRLIATI